MTRGLGWEMPGRVVVAPCLRIAERLQHRIALEECALDHGAVGRVGASGEEADYHLRSLGLPCPRVTTDDDRLQRMGRQVRLRRCTVSLSVR